MLAGEVHIYYGHSLTRFLVVKHNQKTLRMFDDPETCLLEVPLDAEQGIVKRRCLESLEGLTETICEAMQNALEVPASSMPILLGTAGVSSCQSSH